MRVQWATNEKAMMASSKHFNNQYTANEMTTIATALLKRAEYVGTSDRSNGSYAPAKIIWSIYQGTTYSALFRSAVARVPIRISAGPQSSPQHSLSNPNS